MLQSITFAYTLNPPQRIDIITKELLWPVVDSREKGGTDWMHLKTSEQCAQKCTTYV